MLREAFARLKHIALPWPLGKDSERSRTIAPGEGERAGRWWWESAEQERVRLHS